MQLLDQIFAGDFGIRSGGTEGVLFVLLLSFVLGHFIGWVYMWTHSSVSYSQTFTASLAVIPTLVGFMMVLMAGSIIVAFGLLAVFAVVRFRNVLKDTRDTVFILWAILEGLAVGTGAYSTSVTSTLGLAVLFGYLHLTSFGSRRTFETIVNVQLVASDSIVISRLTQLLSLYSLHVHLANERALSDEGVDLSYRVSLRDPARGEELHQKLRDTEGVTRVSLFTRDEDSEI